MSARARCIALVAYGQPELIDAALAPLAGERIVVVDNSAQDRIRLVAQRHGADYVDPSRNLGFAGGVNRAIDALGAQAGAADLLLLNPDAVVSAADLDALQAVFERPGHEDVAAVSPRLRSPDGSEQRVAWPFPAPAAMWREALRLPDHRAQDGFVVGAVLLLRAQALAEVGAFDERYFLYAEETDWQRRAAELGWRSVVAEDVVASHVGAATSESSGRREQLFHAGQETYVRKWFGPLGWQSYRLAALLAAVLRIVAGGGSTRQAARERARLYARGPRRIAFAGPRRPLRVTHVVVTGNAAGTERYVAGVAAEQSRRGLDVSVVGGQREFMRDALPDSVRWRPGASMGRAALQLARLGRQDVVHAHLTAADLLVAAMRPVHRATVVSTRHIAKPRGSGAVNALAARVLEPGIDREVSISHFVASAIGRESTVLHNGVDSTDARPDLGARRIVLAQRLEREKCTELALRAWQQAGMGAAGWTLVVCGDGAEAARLRSSFADPSVRWLGWVADLRAELLAADALLATAPAEPLGLSVLEAMSLGLPVIAADGGGHAETVGSVPYALMFRPVDVEDCAARLREFAATTLDERRELGERLRLAQRQGFSSSGHVDALLDLYEAGRRPAVEARPVRSTA